MDGEAISLAFASQSGPDCFKDVIPKYGARLKVYQVLKKDIEARDTGDTGNTSALVSFYHPFDNAYINFSTLCLIHKDNSYSSALDSDDPVTPKRKVW